MELKARGMDVDTMRLKIQNQAREIMQKKLGQQKRITYIVDRSKRGKEEVNHIVIRQKQPFEPYKMSREVAAYRIVNQVRVKLARLRLAKVWKLLHAIDVKRGADYYSVQFYRRN